MAANALPLITAQQYLEIERAAEFKSEYYNGQMYAMSGGRLAHSLLPQRITVALDAALRGGPCESVSSDLKVGVSLDGPFFYPDLTVYCGEPKLADNHRDVLLNPRVVFEVLSDSSEEFDRGRKFEAYRRVASLQEYVLISQADARIEVWRRQPDDTWLGFLFEGSEAICRLESLSCSLPLADIYRNIPIERD